MTIQKSVFIPLLFLLFSRMGRKTGVYYIDSTALPVCHNRRIRRHKTFASLAARGKTSMGWFFGFKLHLVFNDLHEIVALKLTGGSVSDTKPVPSLTKDLIGKLFGDKGYLGKELAEQLLRRGLALFTRVRKNMKSCPCPWPTRLCLMRVIWRRLSSAASRLFLLSISPNTVRPSMPACIPWLLLWPTR